LAEPAGSRLTSDDLGQTGERHGGGDGDWNERDGHREQQRDVGELRRHRKAKRGVHADAQRSHEHNEARDRSGHAEAVWRR